jgi:hypothetical protein
MIADSKKDSLCQTPYGTWAKVYQDRGLWPRPLQCPGIDAKTKKPLGKACREKGWQTPDSELPPGTRERWALELGHYNIGLLMGTPLPDGTRLGALDIDHDQYTALGKVLLGGNPPCGRFGKKGAVFFVRYIGDIKSQGFKVKPPNESYDQVAELLFAKKLCVIPPSIHPDTNQPYRWLGTPLHEMDFSQLPLIGE